MRAGRPHVTDSLQGETSVWKRRADGSCARRFFRQVCDIACVCLEAASSDWENAAVTVAGVV
jgi:hypothetical protein